MLVSFKITFKSSKSPTALFAVNKLKNKRGIELLHNLFTVFLVEKDRQKDNF
jgi:hypothetical protein